MNALPSDWTTSFPQGASFVLVDGAMQHALGRSFADRKLRATSFFAQESPEAQALGPWLLDAAAANLAQVDGCARGITWLRSTLSFEEAFSHLRPWIVQPFPDGVERGYLRLGDGRILQVLLDSVWTRPQCEAFLQPWEGICLSDRDGRGVTMRPRTHPAHTTRPSRHLNARQYQTLLDASVPDQLLHEVKQHVRPHPLFASREARHAMAVAVIEEAKRRGQDDPYDWMSWIGWALRHGHTSPEAIATHSVAAHHLRGHALWRALIDDEWAANQIDATASRQQAAVG
ncbi:MAG: DUF4123 domain-containing protein [Proteobacteria bacterium]|nr:DUF4123 domain-containing protein [Pseudomonadota bacterium]